MGKSFKIVMGGVAAVIVLCLVFSIDSFDHRTDTVTVGNGSAMHFEENLHDFITVVREGDSLSWKVNEHLVGKDSLFYVKVNGDNPNRHTIDPTQMEVFPSMELVTNKKSFCCCIVPSLAHGARWPKIGDNERLKADDMGVL